VLQLVIKNVLNTQGIYYQDSNVSPRPPNGDITNPSRVSVPSAIGVFEQPRSFMLTATLKM